MKIEKNENMLANLVELRIADDISKEMYEEKKKVIMKQTAYYEEELLKYDVKTDSVVENTNVQIELLQELLNKKYDAIKGDIPDEIVETFVDQIVVHDDYFEWRLRTSVEPVLCQVEGRQKDSTIIFLENDSHEIAKQYRLLSAKRGNKKKTIEKPLKLGTFTIGKEYLNEYKKYHPETKKVNSWKDLVFDISINGI